MSLFCSIYLTFYKYIVLNIANIFIINLRDILSSFCITYA